MFKSWFLKDTVPSPSGETLRVDTGLEQRDKKDESKKSILEEIRFILICFQVKYKSYTVVPKGLKRRNKLPVYGLQNIINKLEKNKLNNFEELTNFLRFTESWIMDTNFILTVNSALSKVDYDTPYQSFLNDVVDLQNQITKRIPLLDLN